MGLSHKYFCQITVFLTAYCINEIEFLYGAMILLLSN